MSRTWTIAFRAFYRLLRVMEPLIRAVWARYGLGNVVLLRLPRRASGRMRSVPLGVLRVDEQMYLGHPNGPSTWTRDLDAAEVAELVPPRGTALAVRAVLLEDGPERAAVIRATNQHPFPGNLVYRLARRHILAVGRYYRLEPVRDVSATEAPP
jgi:hypothetical protein